MITIKEGCRTKLIQCISSKCSDNEHILIWDFDNIDKYIMLKSLSKAQSYNGLGTIIIFRSNHGYNAVCLDKVNIDHAHSILSNTKYNDYWFTEIGYQHDGWAWRIGCDKKYWKHLLPTDDWQKRIGSNKHRLYLKQMYNVDVQIGEYDDSKKILIENYKQNVI